MKFFCSLLLIFILVGCVPKKKGSEFVENDALLLDMCEATMLIIYDINNNTYNTKYTKIRKDSLDFLNKYHDLYKIGNFSLKISQEKQSEFSKKHVSEKVKNTINQMEYFFTNQIKQLQGEEYKKYISALFMKHKPYYDELDKIIRKSQKELL